MMCFKEISRIPSLPQYLSPVWTLIITRMWSGFSHFVSDLGDGGEHMKMKMAYSLVQNVELSQALCTGVSYGGIYLGNGLGNWALRQGLSLCMVENKAAQAWLTVAHERLRLCLRHGRIQNLLTPGQGLGLGSSRDLPIPAH